MTSLGMDHDLWWPDSVVAFFNYFSRDRLCSAVSQSVKVQSVPDRSEFGVNIKKHHPEFTENTPQDIAQDHHPNAGRHVTPPKVPCNGRIVQLHSRPYRERNARGSNRDET